MESQTHRIGRFWRVRQHIGPGPGETTHERRPQRAVHGARWYPDTPPATAEPPHCGLIGVLWLASCLGGRPGHPLARGRASWHRTAAASPSSAESRDLTKSGRRSWLRPLGSDREEESPRAAPRRPPDAGSGLAGQYRRNRQTAASLSRARTRAAARGSPVRQDQACKSPPAAVPARTPGDCRAGCRATLDTHPAGRAGSVLHPASAAVGTCGRAVCGTARGAALPCGALDSAVVGRR